MGYNIAGMLIKGESTQTTIENLLDVKISFAEEVNFEDATTGDREENTIDILQTSSGALIFTAFGPLYDISNFEGEIIQFIISDISDAYYFEKYINGELERKYIYSQGEISEDDGIGIIEQGDDLEDVIWNQADQFLQNDFAENMFNLKFKRYDL